MATSVVRVAIVDDHPLVAVGVEAEIARADDLRWVGRAASLADLRTQLSDWQPRPDVILYDLHLNDGSSPAEGVSELTGLGIAVLIITSEWRPVPIRASVRAGACGVLLKADPAEKLAEAIRTVAAGGFAVSGDLAYCLVTDEALLPGLAPREVEALTLLAGGLPRKLIGKRMSPPVAETTVITYFQRAIKKYQQLGRPVISPQDAVRAAEADGYLDR